MSVQERILEVVAQLVECGDAEMSRDYNGDLNIYLQDYLGFDDNWSEIDREYVRPELVELLEDLIYDEYEGDEIFLHYASEDI